MKVLVVIDGHLIKTPDGKVWSSRIYNYSFFSRYLSAFDEVRVAVRISDKKNNDGYPNLCSGKGIEFYPIDEFRGPKEYAKKYFSIKKKIVNAFNDCDCAIFRIPSSLGFQFCDAFKKTHRPFAVEVVIDPWDFAAPGMLKSITRPLVRIIWTLKLKKICKKANGVSYVTKYALQKRYPCMARYKQNEKYFEDYYSSVNISKSFFSCEKKYEGNYDRIKIIHISNTISNYVKGHKELIESLALLKKENIYPEVTFVGAGELIDDFKKMAKQNNVEEQVVFVGKLSNSLEIREELLKNDLFVFPSHAEGLPRVLIEAMAVGLPCISTNVNGIPELLEDEFLVKVGDVQTLADKIARFVKNPSLMEKESKRNIDIAKQYSEEVLQKRRENFYKKLRRIAYEHKH